MRRDALVTFPGQLAPAAGLTGVHLHGRRTHRAGFELALGPREDLESLELRMSVQTRD